MLFTGIEADDSIRIFDPYLSKDILQGHPEIIDVENQPYSYNRIVPAINFNNETELLYSLGPKDGREAVIIYNTKTKKELPPEQIEYYI